MKYVFFFSFFCFSFAIEENNIFLLIKLITISAPALPDSMLPLGMKTLDNKTKLVPLQPGSNICHSKVFIILQLSFSFFSSENHIFYMNIEEINACLKQFSIGIFSIELLIHFY